MLWKKLFRDLMENKGAYLACIVVIILGILVFTSFSMVVDNLNYSKDAFYEEQNFADGFAELVSLPAGVLAKLESEEGIDRIQGRIVEDVRVLSSDSDKNVYLRLVSYDPNEDVLINGVRPVLGGQLPQRGNEIWLDSLFFDANNLKINDKLEIIANGQRRDLIVKGVGQSPEFVYALRQPTDVYNDPERFGIAFVPLEHMNRLFPDKEGAFNSLVFTLSPGFEYETVERELEKELERYGLRSIYPREDQLSHMFLTMELDGIEAMATALPLLLLSIASIITYIMLKRMMEQQRGQIGILKAMGYTPREIMFHYIFYAIVPGLIGGGIGGLLGIIFAHPLTLMYLEFFNMPHLLGRGSYSYLLSGLLLSFTFSLVAGYQGCKKVINLEPAVAMRAPAPLPGKKTIFERIIVFWNMLTIQGKMSMRNVSRNKGRNLFIFVGIAVCYAITALTWSMNDFMDIFFHHQYERVETYDVKVTLSSPQDKMRGLRELASFPGTRIVEPMAEVPVTLSNGWLEEDVVLLGLEENATLYRILDEDGRRVSPPKEGILLSERLAGLLEVEKGDWLHLESALLRGVEQEKRIQVSGTIPQYLGANVYMELQAVQQFLRQESMVTSYFLHLEDDSINTFKTKYQESQIIAAIDERQELIDMYEELMATYGGTIYAFVFIGVIMGFAIIYNSTIITVAERSRELASMKVLGMTTKEVFSVITFEQWFISFWAMLAGIPLASLLQRLIAEEVSTDLFAMPSDISSSSFVVAFFITLLSVWIAQRLVVRKVNNLSLVEVLKARE